MQHYVTTYVKYVCIAVVASCLVTGGPSYAAFSGELAILNDLGINDGAFKEEKDGKCPEAVRSGDQTCEKAIANVCSGDPDCKGKTVTCQGKGGNTVHCDCSSEGTIDESKCWRTKNNTSAGVLGDAVGGIDLY